MYAHKLPVKVGVMCATVVMCNRFNVGILVTCGGDVIFTDSVVSIEHPEALGG